MLILHPSELVKDVGGQTLDELWMGLRNKSDLVGILSRQFADRVLMDNWRPQVPLIVALHDFLSNSGLHL